MFEYQVIKPKMRLQQLFLYYLHYISFPKMISYLAGNLELTT